MNDVVFNNVFDVAALLLKLQRRRCMWISVGVQILLQLLRSQSRNLSLILTTSILWISDRSRMGLTMIWWWSQGGRMSVFFFYLLCPPVQVKHTFCCHFSFTSCNHFLLNDNCSKNTVAVLSAACGHMFFPQSCYKTAKTYCENTQLQPEISIESLSTPGSEATC